MVEHEVCANVSGAMKLPRKVYYREYCRRIFVLSLIVSLVLSLA